MLETAVSPDSFLPPESLLSLTPESKADEDALFQAFLNDTLRLSIQADPELATPPSTTLDKKETISSIVEWIHKIKRRCCGPWEDVNSFAANLEGLRNLVANIPAMVVPPDAVPALATATQAELSELLKDIRNQPGLPKGVGALGPGEPSFDETNILRWDGLLATRLEAIPNGKQWATKLRAASKTRRDKWDKDHQAGGLWFAWLKPERYAQLLARSLWPSVKARLEKESKKPSALAYLVNETVIDLHRPGTRIRPANQHGQLLLTTADSDEAFGLVKSPSVAVVGMKELEDLVRKGVGLLSSVHGHKLLYWEVETGHTQVLINENEPGTFPMPNRIETEGGWSSVAEAIGVGANKRDEVKAIVVAQAHAFFQFPTWEGNLIAYTERKAKGQKSGTVTIVLGDILMPYFVKSICGKTRSSNQSRSLVPMVGLPPLIGRPNEHGAQCALRLLVVTEMRKRAREMAEGGLREFRERFRELGRTVSLSESLSDRIYDAWLTAEKPFLKEASGLTTLADTNLAARVFIEDFGKTSEIRSNNARKSQAIQHARKNGTIKVPK